MPAINWDTSLLPEFVQQDSFTETIVDPVLRTEMESGPKKTRLRYTSVPEEFTISLVLTEEQRTYFLTFYRVTLSYGVSEFNWKHPVTHNPAICRFTGPYSLVPNGLGFTLTISMEIIL